MMYFLYEEHNWFWSVEADIGKDYNYYFARENPQKLSEKYPGN